MKHTVLSSALFLSTFIGLHAESLSTAQTLMNQGKFSQAADALASLASQNAGNAQYQFLYGQAALQAQRPKIAKAQFETMLAKNPNLPRVKLDLALAEEQLGNFDAARTRYQEVLAANPPANVKANIEKKLNLLANVEKRGVEKKVVKAQVVKEVDGKKVVVEEERIIQQVKKKNWSGDFTTGLFYDTNVNAGPDTDTVSIFDLPFVLDDNAKGQDDWGFQVKANFRYNHEFNQRWSGFGSLRYQRIDYDKNNRFDFDSLGFTLGAVYKAKAYQLVLPVDYTVNFLGGDTYTKSFGISPQLQYRIDPQWVSTTALSATTNTNAQVGDRTGESYSISQSFQWTAKGGQLSVIPRIYYAHDNAKVDFLSSNQVGVGLGLNANLGEKWSAYVEPGFRYTKYEGDEPLFGDTREEPQFTLTANLTRELPWWDMDAVLGYTYNNNFANLDLYEYDRHQVSLLFRKEF